MIWSGDGECCVAVANGENWKDEIGDSWPNEEQSAANERLIVAAPELFESAAELLATIRDYQNDDGKVAFVPPSGVVERLSAVIGRVIGQEVT